MKLQELVLEQRTGMEQISTFAGLDVLIAAHGAGVTNIIFMLPNSMLYELFPPQWKFACYRRLAANVGVLYVKDMAEGEVGPQCRKSFRSQACQYGGIRDRDFTMKEEVVMERVKSVIELVLKEKYHVNWKCLLGVCASMRRVYASMKAVYASMILVDDCVNE